MMKNNFKTLFLVLTFCFFSTVLTAQNDLSSDKLATQETKNLFYNLRKLKSQGTLIGHQDATVYGVTWKHGNNKSDIKEITGEYPAVYGWDMSGYEKNKRKNIDRVSFKKIRKQVQAAYLRGGINTFSWHSNSPWGNNAGAWDTTKGTVASILPGGINHSLYIQWLDRIATFLSSLKGSNNELIPVLFRPYHELSGSWFWWGKNETSVNDIKRIWQFTVEYLRDKKNIHNLLYVYNTNNDFLHVGDFLERYPGNEYVDIISFDAYQFNQDNTFFTQTSRQLQVLDSAGSICNKITALAETGYETIPDKKWWTETLYPLISNSSIAYVLLWRNAGYLKKEKKMHYYAPYAEHASAENFKEFYQYKKTLFEKDVLLLNMYR